MNDLPLQVADVHHVKVDQPDRADTRCRQVVGERRTQATRADTQHLRCLQLTLSLLAHLRQDQVPRVASQIIGRQFRKSRLSQCGRADGRRRTAGNRRNDRQRIGLRYRRILMPVQVANIFIVKINIHESAQLALFRVEMLFQVRMSCRQLRQRFAHGRRVDIDHVQLAGIHA